MQNASYDRRIKPSLILLLIACGGAVLVAIVASLSSFRAFAGDPGATFSAPVWPALSFEYTQTTQGKQATNRLVYNSPQNWSIETIKSTDPDDVGFRHVYDGVSRTTYLPRVDDTIKTASDPLQVYLPSEWLHPAGSDTLLPQGFRQVSVNAGQTTFEKRYSTPVASPSDCKPNEPNCAPLVKSDQTVDIVETRIYRSDYMIPVRLEYRSNGAMYKSIEVSNLTFR